MEGIHISSKLNANYLVLVLSSHDPSPICLRLISAARASLFSCWQAVERVLFPHLPAYWANLQAVLDDYSVSNAQVKADGHKVYGAILVSIAVESLHTVTNCRTLFVFDF